MIVVAHIITDLFTGGAEAMLQKLVMAMDQREFEPVVISLLRGGPTVHKLRNLGIRLFELGMNAGVPDPRALWGLQQIIKQVNPDLIQGWMYHGNLAAQLTSEAVPRRRIPVVWNIRGTRVILRDEKPLTAATIWLGARLSSRAAKIVNNSSESARQHELHLGYAGDKWEIIPNGFDTAVFRPSSHAREYVRSQLGIDANTFVIGMFARFHPVKDHSTFLTAMRIVTTKYPKTAIVLAGTGLDCANAELTSLLERTNQFHSTYLLGNRSDVSALNACLDLAVLSSTSEGFPNSIGEAMSCGVPCVATDVGDCRFLIGDTGICVPPNDPKALANAIERMIDMGPEERGSRGRAARERVEEYFTIAVIAGKYGTLYNRVVRERRRREN